MSHIAQSNSEAFANVADIEPLPVPEGYDKRTVIKFLNDSFDWCAKQFAAMTPAQFDRMLNIGEGRQATGIEVVCWAFTDTAHHRAKQRSTCASRTSSRPDMCSSGQGASRILEACAKAAVRGYGECESYAYYCQITFHN